jgi:hypothetical protein
MDHLALTSHGLHNEDLRGLRSEQGGVSWAAGGYESLPCLSERESRRMHCEGIQPNCQEESYGFHWIEFGLYRERPPGMAKRE